MAVRGWTCVLFAAVTFQLAVAVVQKVRLTDGDSESEGRVEVYDSARWFSLCGYDWTIPAARTVCRELGFGDLQFPKSTYGMRTSFFGKGSQTIYPRGFDCLPGSASLSECRETRVRCGLGDDVASVFCKDRVRLSGGAVPHQGRLEVLLDGVWTTVCGRSWGDPEAQVACRQLGFPGAVDWRWSEEYFPQAPEGVPTPRYVLACNGSERSLLSCNKLQVGDCSHSEDVGLLCEAGVRLAGGVAQSEGRVEVYHRGRWGVVCDRDWAAHREGAVVCRELGFYGNGFHSNAENIPSVQNGDSFRSPVWINGTRCTGTEDRLRRCVFERAAWGPGEAGRAGCGTGEAVAVRCNGSSKAISFPESYSITPTPGTRAPSDEDRVPATLSAGSIAAITVCAVIIAILLVILVVLLVVLRRKRDTTEWSRPPPYNPEVPVTSHPPSPAYTQVADQSEPEQVQLNPSSSEVTYATPVKTKRKAPPPPSTPPCGDDRHYSTIDERLIDDDDPKSKQKSDVRSKRVPEYALVNKKNKQTRHGNDSVAPLLHDSSKR
ncbi:PREDICTED: CD5 antigen-like [Branchiostoma belcheri]|uniref:CD5 antigen-like n=1 Tax=Branchiostoma belcheri TaxID=7741 RepID=A0A6P5AV37_BRABE|nr:PREDICTED: CD5 antigen-like [Branchiostoma belcheri]